MIRNRVLEALYQRIMRAYNDKKSFRVIIVIPLLPGFQVLIYSFFGFSSALTTVSCIFSIDVGLTS